MFLHVSDSQSRFRRTAPLVLPLFATGLILLLMFGAPTGATAQEIAAVDLPEATNMEMAPRTGNALGISSTVWRAHFGEQTGVLLRTGSDVVKDQSLENIILVSELDQNGIDLSEAVPELVKVVKFGSRSAQRLMALQALNNIGTDHAREAVYRHAMEEIRRFLSNEQPLQESNRIHRSAAFVLYNFYNERGEE